MEHRLGLLLSILLCTASASFAQGFAPTFSGGGVVPSLGKGSSQPILVDPKRFQMRQSVTISAMAGGGSTLSQSYYQNSMEWKLSDPLTLHLDLGIMAPMSASGPMAQAYKPGAYLVPAVALEYKPSESVMMVLQYSGMSSAPVGSKGGLPWR
ncbi:MAG: hypothetical protein RL173_2777 [Fibrobacterota bacterium]|jgi:hypothetical protein